MNASRNDDHESIGNLELSVRSENVLNRAGILTVGQLRRLTNEDFDRMRDQQGRSSVTVKVRKDIDEALADWDKGADARQKASENRYVRVSREFGELSSTQRERIFKDHGQCMCSDVVKFASKHKAATVGAGLGAIVGLLFEVPREPQTATVRVGSGLITCQNCGGFSFLHPHSGCTEFKPTLPRLK